MLCADGDYSGGTGVRVGGNTILTAAHVVSCVPMIIMVATLDGHASMATVDGRMTADVARLSAPYLDPVAPARIGTHALGDRLCILSALPEFGRRCGDSWPDFKDSVVGAIHIDAVAEHGNSGGGVWNERGELVGILVHLRYCQGTDENGQICTGAATSLIERLWIAAP